MKTNISGLNCQSLHHLLGRQCRLHCECGLAIDLCASADVHSFGVRSTKKLNYDHRNSHVPKIYLNKYYGLSAKPLWITIKQVGMVPVKGIEPSAIALRIMFST